MTAARLVQLLLAVLAGLAVCILALTPLAGRLERDTGLRLLYSLRGSTAVPDEAVVLAIDRRSVDWLRFLANAPDGLPARLEGCVAPEALEALASAYSPSDLPRGIYACALERVAAAGASLAVLDVLFAKPTDEDDRLADALTVLPTLLFERIDTAPVGAGAALALRHSPREPFRAAAIGTGFSVIEAPAGGYLEGYVARLPTFPELRDLASLAWAHHRGNALPPPIGPATQPLWLYGPPGTLAHLSLRDVIDRPPPPGALLGKVVFIGLSEPETPGVPDHFRVPVPPTDGRAMAGVEIMATAFLNRLHGQTLSRPADLPRALISGGLALLAVLAALALPGRRGLAAILALAAIYAGLAAGGFLAGGLWLPIAVPLMLVAPAALLSALAMRYARARRLVSVLTPRPVASELLDTRDDDERRFRTEPTTVVICDLAGSTRLGTELSPERYGETIQGFYDLVAAPIEAEGGLLVEFPGDAIVAVFTESFGGASHALRALAAVRGVVAALGASGSAGIEPLRARISMNSGLAATGDIGARHRYNFKALGDAVTLAFAIERFSKSLPLTETALVVASAATAELAAEALAEREREDLGAVPLPGRAEPERLLRLRI